MPFYDEEQIQNALVSRQTGGLEVSVDQQVEAPEETGFVDAVKAFYKTEDPVFSATKGFFAPPVEQKFDPEFKPLERLQEERPDLVGNITSFSDVRNEEDYYRTIQQVELENENKEIFDRAPTFTKVAAGLTASVVDPTILIPFVGIAKKASTIARVGSGLAAGAGLGLGSSLGREAILQSTQETRTAEESVANIIAETTFGGLLGAAAGALSDPVAAAGRKVLAKALIGEDYKIRVNEDGTAQVLDDSLSAAARKDELEDLGLAHINETLAKVISGPEGLRAPDLRAILSPSESVRKLGEVFYNSNYIREKNIEGIASGPRAQNAIFRSEQEVHKVLNEVDQLYYGYTGKGLIGSTVARDASKISHSEFSDRIWRNLTDSNRVDEIAEVNQASKLMRKQMDDMAKKLQEAELLPKDLDPEFMRNYMSRVYDLNKLSVPRMQGRFISKVAGWIKKHNKDGSLRAKVLDDDVAEGEAIQILDKIRGETDQQIALSSISEGFISKGKFTKERQLLIPDSEISEFLQTDSLRLFNNYMGRATKLLETQKALKRAGFDSIQDVIQQIKSEAASAVRGLSDQDALAVSKRFKEQEDLVNMMYRSMLGQLRKPGKADRWAEALLNYQFVRLLGGVTISSIPEIFMAPFRLGILNTVRDGYLPMIRSLKTSKLAKDQLNDLSGALEFEQSNVLRALGGIDDIENLGRNQDSWDKVQNALVKGFVKSSGIGHWTSIHRRISTQISAADIIRTLKKGPKGSDIERLAHIGIGKADYDRVLAQIDKHVQSYKGTYVSNPHLWDDAEALEIFKDAVQNQVESVILKPGVESLPFFVQQSQWAKVIFQFKSFMSAATSKVTISGIQRRDANALMGLMGLVTMGALSGAAHDLVMGRDVSDDPLELILEGVSRSGVAGLLGTTIIDTTRAFTNEKTRRFGGKYVSSAILGPSASQIEEITKITQRLTDGDVTDKDKKAAARMIPFMNLFYIKAITERVFNEE